MQQGDPPPFIEEYHVIATDQIIGSPPEHIPIGNSASGNHTFLLSDIVVHGLPTGGQSGSETRLVFDLFLTEGFSIDSDLIPLRTMDPNFPIPENDENITSTGWVPRNGFGQKSAWPIEVGTYVPEPATFGIIAIGGVVLIRRRKLNQ